MQKLETRNTYTPTDVPQVRSNCDQTLKALRGRSGVSDLKTVSNSPDAALTATREQAGQNLRVSAVYVLNQRGQPLMPCLPHKAKMLLKAGKAKVVIRTPFTIQLLCATGEAKQDITLGIDSGYKYVGLSAITEQKELYATDVELRSDIVALNSERRQYRKTRRIRKIWYRKARFLNRGNYFKGWLAPSIRHKKDSHCKIIIQMKNILPVTHIIIEVANFDIQKIKNPDIEGVGYQQGEQLGFWNTREYVLYRDNHTCQHCKGKSKDTVLITHHIVTRKTGGDRPENFFTLCETCHSKYHTGKIEIRPRVGKGFKAETFMSTIKWKLVNELKDAGENASHTYGYITKQKRIEQGLSKSHINDAFVIAGGNRQLRADIYYKQKQVRKCNRKLFKGIRSHIRNTASRFIHGFQRFDKVLWKEIECFIFGRRQTGYFNLRRLDGTNLNANAKVKDCILLESASTLLVERMSNSAQS